MLLSLPRSSLNARFYSSQSTCDARSRVHTLGARHQQRAQRGFQHYRGSVSTFGQAAKRERNDVAARAGFEGNQGLGETTGGDGDSLVQVKVERIQSEKNAASILYLSLRDRSGSVMPVYVGEAESLALEMEISNKRNTTRPIMYDLFKSFVERSGYELSHVIIDDLKSKTYHATCYFKGSQEGAMTIKLDSRPSDALNLAVRFNRPIFVTKAVLELAKDFLIPREKVRFGGGVPAGSRGEVRKGHMSRTSPLSGAEREEIEASVRNLLLHYVDPNMVELQARLQIATMEERFEDAAAIRDLVEVRLSQDRVTSVCVAMEAAVDGKRFEEAAVLRNTFLFLMEQKEKEEKKRNKKDKIDA